MTSATHLHWYRCSFCHAVATSPVLVKSLLRCESCRRLLAFLYSTPVETDEDRARAEGGIVYSVIRRETPPPKIVRCQTRLCLVFKPETEMIHVPGIGTYCSHEHAEEGKRGWERFVTYMRKLKEADPWLDISAMEQQNAELEPTLRKTS